MGKTILNFGKLKQTEEDIKKIEDELTNFNTRIKSIYAIIRANNEGLAIEQLMDYVHMFEAESAKYKEILADLKKNSENFKNDTTKYIKPLNESANVIVDPGKIKSNLNQIKKDIDLFNIDNPGGRNERETFRPEQELEVEEALKHEHNARVMQEISRKVLSFKKSFEPELEILEEVASKASKYDETIKSYAGLVKNNVYHKYSSYGEQTRDLLGDLSDLKDGVINGTKLLINGIIVEPYELVSGLLSPKGSEAYKKALEQIEALKTTIKDPNRTFEQMADAYTDDLSAKGLWYKAGELTPELILFLVSKKVSQRISKYRLKRDMLKNNKNISANDKSFYDFMSSEDINRYNNWWESKSWSLNENGAVINGRRYTKHSLERMAPDTPEVRAKLRTRANIEAIKRGYIKNTKKYDKYVLDYVKPRNIPSIIVEDCIKYGKKTKGARGTFIYQNSQVKVIVNLFGDVVTVFRIK